MWWRANSLMTDDLKKSSKAKLSKEFYVKSQTQNHKACTENLSNKNLKNSELCELNRALISYKDVCLPDRIHGGRSTQPNVVPDNNELLQKQV